MPKLTQNSFKEIMIPYIVKGGHIGDPIEPEFASFKRKNLYDYFVKTNKTRSKTCKWFMSY